MYKWMILIAEDFQFPLQDFVVMLFHYDGVLDDWNQYPWSAHAIHVSVMNQTKWSVSCNSCNSYIYQNNNWMMLMWQVVRQTILASWCSCRVWIYFPLGRRSRCRSFQSSTVVHQYFFCFFFVLVSHCMMKSFYFRYLSIVKEEGLEISQPGLDPTESEVYHPITARRENLKVHRRIYKYKGGFRCDGNSTDPPCIG